jgi:hypothetical protein
MRFGWSGWASCVWIGAGIGEHHSLLSADGHFRFIYTIAGPVLVRRFRRRGVQSTINVNLNCVCLSTRPPARSFAVNLLARFIPEPGFAFSSINLSIRVHWASAGRRVGAGYQFSASTTITSLNNRPR